MRGAIDRFESLGRGLSVGQLGWRKTSRRHRGGEKVVVIGHIARNVGICGGNVQSVPGTCWPLTGCPRLPNVPPMRKLMCLLPAGVLLLAQGASAQVQPHRAEYVLRLGAAVNAPRVGTATQDLSLGCDGWHLKRDVKGEVPISATWKFNVASTLESDEGRSGDELQYRSLQVQNGTEREVRGKVQRADGELRAESTSSDGPAHVQLPTLTRMPIASIGYIIDRLRAGSASFATLSFDAQASGDIFRVDVMQLNESALRRRPLSEKPIVVQGRSWPVQMSFMRGGKEQQKPLFAFSARLFESGVLDHVTVDTDVVTVAADLRTLEMRPTPTCQ